ncbi:MAG: hypothetical protein CME06_05950 [Gemmatimonadetes bacterium]|nr:hypothetical protein [Gemmatimonadota bacterium]
MDVEPFAAVNYGRIEILCLTAHAALDRYEGLPDQARSPCIEAPHCVGLECSATAAPRIL